MIKNKLKWHCRKAGGLFVGIRISFPSNLVEFKTAPSGIKETRYKVWYIVIGFVFFSWNIELMFEQKD